MHIFHSRENIKNCIFNGRIDIFTGEKLRLELLFLFSQYGLREATLYGISVSFLRETTNSVSYYYGNVNKKSESLRSLIKKELL